MEGRARAVEGSGWAGVSPGEVRGGCSASAGPTICFTRPELYDVIHPETGGKIAGAAQKRTKDGLLFQGSLLRAAAPGITDYDTLHAAFVSALSAALRLPANDTPWPDFPEGEHEALTEQYSTREWIEAR